jgi:predicted alpha/beta superfamily hydrolase
VKTGGAAWFKQVLEDEIIPFVNMSFRVTKEKALFGHSYGGLFASYLLFQSTALFDHYIISSATLDWDDNIQNGTEIFSKT